MSEYDQRPEPAESAGRAATSLPSARDALAPYLAASEGGPFTKLSISLPEPLIATVREVSEQTGVSVSGVIAASLRRLLDEVLQARIDAAPGGGPGGEPGVGPRHGAGRRTPAE